jgi:hypothetical protein
MKKLTLKQFQERCWTGYKSVPGKKPYSPGSCTKEESELEEASYGIGSSPSFARSDREARRRDRQDDERWTPPAASSRSADEPHHVIVGGGKILNTFGSRQHAQNVANKIKGATIRKAEKIKEANY